jgi:hypothetical protein
MKRFSPASYPPTSKGTVMQHLEPELPDEKLILRKMERQHGDMLPGSLAALEAISEQFKGSAPVTVYWFLAHDWDRKHQYVDGEDDVAHNLNAPIKRTFNIHIEIRHELQPRRFRRLSAFVTEQRRRLLSNYHVVEPTPFLLRHFIYRRHFQAITWEIKPSRTATPTVCSVGDIFFNIEHRKVYLLMETDGEDSFE